VDERAVEVATLGLDAMLANIGHGNVVDAHVALNLVQIRQPVAT